MLLAVALCLAALILGLAIGLSRKKPSYAAPPRQPRPQSPRPRQQAR
jgi:hypothetical protein